MKIARISFALLFGLIISTSFASAATYNDMDKANWAKDSIQAMSEYGFVGGYEDGSFMPQKEITRAEFISILNKMNNFTAEADINFADVKETSWAFKEIKKAVAAGYVAGFNDNTFKPNELVTREQVAVILSNLYKLENKSPEDIKINDINEISPWAREAVIKVVSNGIMNGYSDGSFGAKKSIIRAEGVVALNKIITKEIPNQAGYIVPKLNQQPSQVQQNPITVTPPATQTPSTGSSSGGSGGSGGGGSSTTPSINVNESLNDVVKRLDTRVITKLETDLQKETAELISDSIKSYLNDNKYSLDADVQKARDLADDMSPEEKQKFKSTITENIPVSQLIKLNEVFKIIDMN